MEQNGTKKTRLATDVEGELLQAVDDECKQKQCSRADVLRWALLERFPSARLKTVLAGRRHAK